jgi:two-component system KDP operon response regulator KdpE
MEGGRRILLVDDACDLRVYLEMHDYIVLQAAGTNEALAKVRTALPDLVVLVVMTPGMDGINILHAVRSISAVPLIMVTAKGADDDKVRALRLGADDYVTRPFSQRELLARIESVLRRAGPHEALAVDADLTIDFARNRVIRRGTEEPLTATEHRLLYHLVSNAGRLMPFEALLTRVWGPEYREQEHYVRLYVSYLRAKIEPNPAHPRYILTEKGLGYRFADLPGVDARTGRGSHRPSPSAPCSSPGRGDLPQERGVACTHARPRHPLRAGKGTLFC